MREAIEHLYETFSRYRVTDFRDLGCFDFGPNDQEHKAVSGLPLCEVPRDVIESMEFYDRTWESWGTENEVKYFLPRILEVVAGDLELLEMPATFSLFQYKLHGSLNDWPELEAAALRAWAGAMLAYHLPNSPRAAELIEAVAEMGLHSGEVIRFWDNVDPARRLAQVDDPWDPAYSRDPAVLATLAEVAAWLGVGLSRYR